jgi:SAM-dependent methyltransferase
MSVFGEYAQFYDTLYRDKDYAAEVAYLEAIFARWGGGQIHSVLDLGCGTGSHALPLAERGYAVTGVDQSAAMLAQARAKLGDRARFEQGDLRSVDLGQTFDAVVSMFAVFGYMISNEDLAAAFQTARRHTRKGGLFFFDAWFGPAVLAERPSDRYKIFDTGGERVIRFVHPELDVLRHVVEVNYKVLRLAGATVVAEVDEVHPMRYLFPQEVAYYLQQAGFAVKHLGTFLHLDGGLDPRDWNLAVVAEAV